MTWEEFLEYLAAYAEELDSPDVLLMNGPPGDNGTAYLSEQKGVLEDCTWSGMLEGGRYEGKDFVWFGDRKVRVMGRMQTGGHPALAGHRLPSCAGVVRDGFLFFHSGHFHPKAQHAVVFLLVFVRDSCEGLSGLARDKRVAKLCRIGHLLYCDDSEKETYTASLADLLGYKEKVSVSTNNTNSEAIAIPRSTPMGIGKSQPVSIKSSKPASGPVVVSSPKPVITNSPPSTVASSTQQASLDLGISPSGRHMSQSSGSGGRPRWVPDSEARKCQQCRKSFSITLRKHHCRQCGNIFCADCSKRSKEVRLPAQNEGKEEKGKLRVCDHCAQTAYL